MSNANSGALDCLVIGAGHAGLAVSHYLAERSIDHLVVERGEVANSWRKERWDSLKLLTPNWQTRLPGYEYQGNEPDDFMDMNEVVDFIEGYAGHINAPVQTGTTVASVALNGQGYHVRSDRGDWKCRTLVVASGACNLPSIPRVSEALPSTIEQVHSLNYRNPAQLAEGGVLVVGASATGLQLAEEIHSSGRPVTIAAGEHVRLPRRYRGHDIQWWMDRTGVLDEGLDVIDDVNRARHLPSPQLIGNSRHAICDLNRMTDMGIGLVGRLMGVNGTTAQFSGSLKNVCQLADLKMNRLLNSIDEWIEQSDPSASYPEAERFEATRVDESPRLIMDLESAGINTVLWATGYRPDYSWLDLDILDRKGMIKHDAGVAESPGLYVLGMPFLRKRKSSFIHGVEDDARHITEHLCAHIDSN